MILVIPFPTMTSPGEGIQENQQLLHGGYFVKNVLAFFVILSLYYFYREKKWRDHLLLITTMISYLVVIALSSHAQSERFHLPAIPIFLIFAAYGVLNIKMIHKNWFNYYLTFLFIVLVGWNLFKLAGRSLV